MTLAVQMRRQISIKPYHRPFQHPLRTARGVWEMRMGWLLRVEQAGQAGYGEVAPLPEFGSESFAEAADCLRQLIQDPERNVPATHPCCAFALSAALWLQHSPARDYAVSALLPAGTAALAQSTQKSAAGYQSLKWKIGVQPLAQELALARDLLEALPATVRLRFDANASLTLAELQEWLTLLRAYPEQVDYIEQPLACGEEAAMAACMQTSGVAIALDESLNGAEGHRWLEVGAWLGPLVIKAPLMGDIGQLTQKLEPLAQQVVLSSVFETGIGMENSLQLADALPALERSLGFDTVTAFADSLNHIPAVPEVCTVARRRYAPEQIWNLI